VISKAFIFEDKVKHVRNTYDFVFHAMVHSRLLR